MSETLHPEETITSFWLVRHGDTQATESGRLYTDYQAPLTEKGKRQAESLASYFAQEKPDVLVSSPSVRVFATAQIISQSIGIEAGKISGLNEWHVGDWEGRTYLDLKKSEPELYQAWSKDPIHNAPPNGESIIDLSKRACDHLKQLIAKYQGKHVLLVTHAGIIRSILVHALEMPIENFWRLAIPCGSVTKVDFSQNFATVCFTAYRPS